MKTEAVRSDDRMIARSGKDVETVLRHSIAATLRNISDSREQYRMGRERLSKLRKDRSLTHDELTLSCSRPLRVNLLYEKFWCDVSIVLCNFLQSLTEWSETTALNRSN